MFRKNLNYKIIYHYHCDQGRLLIVNVEIDGIGYSIVNIHAPNVAKDRINFFVDVKCLIGMHALFPTRLLMGGDFNCVLTASDRFSERVDVSSAQLNNLVKLLQLYDVWRNKHGQSRDFTYIDPSHNMHNRIIDL